MCVKSSESYSSVPWDNWEPNYRDGHIDIFGGGGIKIPEMSATGVDLYFRSGCE